MRAHQDALIAIFPRELAISQPGGSLSKPSYQRNERGALFRHSRAGQSRSLPDQALRDRLLACLRRSRLLERVRRDLSHRR